MMNQKMNRKMKEKNKQSYGFAQLRENMDMTKVYRHWHSRTLVTHISC